MLEEETPQSRADAVLERVLSRAGTAVAEGGTKTTDYDGDQLEREERAALRRVGSLSTQLEDVSEVEYRQLRLEKVVLVGLIVRGTTAEAEISLRELAALAETAGSEVLDGLLQRRSNPDPATYIGKGKAQELKEIVASVGADTVVVDDELAPSQRRALEDVVKVKVVDRTALILDIFAQHAKSKEGKAQVELAQLEYLLPRLRGWGESMSRQAGGQVGGAAAGMGSRGPGETKIELDRRRIRNRMALLRRQIKAMAPAREVRRDKRLAMPNVAIVGYTNAGKSSLLNRITNAGVLVENSFFATLDPTVRRSQTPDGREFTVSDTVGFVRNLPHQLVAAFASTLEEVANATASRAARSRRFPPRPRGPDRRGTPCAGGRARRVRGGRGAGAQQGRHRRSGRAHALAGRPETTIEVSALTGEGMDELPELGRRAIAAARGTRRRFAAIYQGRSCCRGPLKGRGDLRAARRRGYELVALVSDALAARMHEAAEKHLAARD